MNPAASASARSPVHAGPPKLDREQWFPRPRPEVFAFFADARNLEAITPPWLKFVVLTPGPLEMRAGLRIDYRLRVRGVPLRWRTLISAWEPPFRFVDEQERGPYREWIHEHLFEECDGGTLVRDRVHYRAPGGWLIETLLVRADVQRIFTHRQEVLARLLGTPAGLPVAVSPGAITPASSTTAQSHRPG